MTDHCEMVVRPALVATAFAFLVAMLLLPVLARAQGSTGGDDGAHRVAVDFAVARWEFPAIDRRMRGLDDGPRFTTATSIPVLTSGLTARIRIVGASTAASLHASFLDIDLIARAVIGQSASLGDWIVHPGDPYVGARWGWRSGRLTRHFGLGATLPFGSLADRPHESERLLAYARGYALTYWDPWLISPQTFSLVLRGSLALEERWFTVGGELAIAAMIGIGPDPWFTGAVLQVGGWAGARIGPIDFGVRSSATIGFIRAAGISAGPFVRLRAGWLSVEARAQFGPGSNPLYCGQVMIAANVP